MITFKLYKKDTGIERAEVLVIVDGHAVSAEVFPIYHDDTPPSEFKTAQRNWERVMVNISGATIFGFVRGIANELGSYDVRQ